MDPIHKWMESHHVVEMLRYAAYAMRRDENYTAILDLMNNGEATVKLKVHKLGKHDQYMSLEPVKPTVQDTAEPSEPTKVVDTSISLPKLRRRKREP